MFTPYRRPDQGAVAAPVFDPVDPLTGAVPSWRLDEEPIYLEVLAALGVPGLDEPATPAPVIAGDVVDPDDPGGDRVVEDDDEDDRPRDVEGPPTRALRLVESPAPSSGPCPDCGAAGSAPCRPKRSPATGRPLTRWHRRRRALEVA